MEPGKKKGSCGEKMARRLLPFNHNRSNALLIAQLADTNRQLRYTLE
jgi:hypothetical protein